MSLSDRLESDRFKMNTFKEPKRTLHKSREKLRETRQNGRQGGWYLRGQTLLKTEDKAFLYLQKSKVYTHAGSTLS